MPWSKFLKAHWEALAAADFFTVEVWSKIGLVRYLVFFVIDLPTRRVEIAGIAPVPNGLWMPQVARHLIDDVSGFLRGNGFLIHDRDPLYTREFRELLGHAGVTSVRLPPRSPNLNAYAERFMLSIKSECLDRMVLMGSGTYGKRSGTTWSTITSSDATRGSAIVQSRAFQNPPTVWFCGTSGWADS